MKNKGISLIVLVITIIVIIILAAAVILTLNKNNPIENANKASFQQDLDSFKSDLDLTHSKLIADSIGEYDFKKENINPYEDITKLKELIPSITINYEGILGIKNGLLVISQEATQKQIEWAAQIDVKLDKVIGKDGANIPIFPTIDGKPNSDIKAISWDFNKEVEYSNMPESEWYKYEQQTVTTENGGTSKWANMKTKDGSYFVWIPRYAYKITSGYHMGGNTAGTIDVKLMKGTSNTKCSDGTTLPADYKVHDAFTFDGKSLVGIWVSKYEASNYNEKVRIVPNEISWRAISHKKMFDNCILMQGDSNVYGWSTNNAHMMKNNEWGAIAYFTHSKFGRNATEVTINNNSKYITGMAGDSISAMPSEETINKYDTKKGMLASTTGNIYGVYDMNGGAFEYTAAFLRGYTTTGLVWTVDQINSNQKYFDLYEPSGENSNAQENYIKNEKLSVQKGDAIYETSFRGMLENLEMLDHSSWFEDSSYFADLNFPVLPRGGDFRGGVISGIFFYSNSRGNLSATFRAVIGI
ncbi:MAG: hypothetical protein RSE00_05670 [Clostridia bacterium]